MPRDADRRGDRPIGYTRRFRLLSHEIELRADDDVLGRQLDYLTNAANVDFPVSARLDIEIAATQDGYRVKIDGADPIDVRGPQEVLFHLYGPIHAAATACMSGAVELHAASLIANHRRILVFGPSGAGKTTLAVMALRAGWPVEGDELVYLTEGGALALPRRFHVKAEGLSNFPDWARRLRALPEMQGKGRSIYAFDPTEFGYDWRIGRGPVAGLVYLDRASAVPDGMSPCSKVEMVRHLMAHGHYGGMTRIDPIAALSSLADRARCCVLRVREPAEGLRELEKIVF